MKNDVAIKCDKFISSLTKTNIVLESYTKWNSRNKSVGIRERIQKNQWDCNQLNLLLSKTEEDFLKKFKNNFEKLKMSFKILPLLIASRKQVDVNQKNQFLFFRDCTMDKEENININDENNVLLFIKKSGLLDNVFTNELCKDIYTYCFGVEVGLSSHSRKNISGRMAENKVNQILIKNNVEELKEKPCKNEIKEIENIILDENKEFDFSFKYKNILYLVEVNYYGVGGSKSPGEIERFININNKIVGSKIPNIKFLYITDGLGWLKNKDKLKMVIENIENVYNFSLLENEFFSVSNK